MTEIRYYCSFPNCQEGNGARSFSILTGQEHMAYHVWIETNHVSHFSSYCSCGANFFSNATALEHVVDLRNPGFHVINSYPIYCNDSRYGQQFKNSYEFRAIRLMRKYMKSHLKIYNGDGNAIAPINIPNRKQQDITRDREMPRDHRTPLQMPQGADAWEDPADGWNFNPGRNNPVVDSNPFNERGRNDGSDDRNIRVAREACRTPVYEAEEDHSATQGSFSTRGPGPECRDFRQDDIGFNGIRTSSEIQTNKRNRSEGLTNLSGICGAPLKDTSQEPSSMYQSKEFGNGVNRERISTDREHPSPGSVKVEEFSRTEPSPMKDPVNRQRRILPFFQPSTKSESTRKDMPAQFAPARLIVPPVSSSAMESSGTVPHIIPTAATCPPPPQSKNEVGKNIELRDDSLATLRGKFDSSARTKASLDSEPGSDGSRTTAPRKTAINPRYPPNSRPGGTKLLEGMEAHRRLDPRPRTPVRSSSRRTPEPSGNRTPVRSRSPRRRTPNRACRTPIKSESPPEPSRKGGPVKRQGDNEELPAKRGRGRPRKSQEVPVKISRYDKMKYGRK